MKRFQLARKHDYTKLMLLLLLLLLLIVIFMIIIITNVVVVNLCNCQATDVGVRKLKKIKKTFPSETHHLLT